LVQQALKNQVVLAEQWVAQAEQQPLFSFVSLVAAALAFLHDMNSF